MKARLAPLPLLLLAAACTHTPPTTKGALFTPSPFLQRLEWDTLVNTPPQEEGRQRRWDAPNRRPAALVAPWQSPGARAKPVWQLMTPG